MVSVILGHDKDSVLKRLEKRGIVMTAGRG
jgi:hypothetical protein